MRKLASIRKISSLDPIPGADLIEVATVDGWKCVVKKGEYQLNDLVVYCEVDSWIPTELAPFLSKGKEPREYEGVKGERLRTLRIKKQISQGLLLPFTAELAVKIGAGSGAKFEDYEGVDVSELLNIKKWEMAVPAQLAGQVKGNFPSVIPKTDQERAQNLVAQIAAATEGGNKFELTEKLEGSSMTCYLIDGVFGVCSRNLDLKRDESNTFWSVAIRDDIETKMRNRGGNLAIQGELIGPGIQGNIYKLSKPEFHVFDVYDVESGEYMLPKDRRAMIENMGLNHVPVLDAEFVLMHTVDELLVRAEGKSILADTEREGIVFKEVNGGMTFKAISNFYLTQEREVI